MSKEKNRGNKEAKKPKKEKVKVNEIVIHGNEALKEGTLERAMKKTNEPKLINLFRTKNSCRKNIKMTKSS